MKRRSRGDGGPPPLACREVVELVTDYLEGALSPAWRARLGEHLAACRDCAAYLDQLRTMVRALARVRPPDLDRRVRQELLAAYREWIAA